MSWISSKLKVAESFLQQIDQQAAESLKKNEGSRPDVFDDNVETPPRATDSAVVPLKDQLSRRSAERAGSYGHSRSNSESEKGRLSDVAVKPSVATSSVGFADGEDWTELLGPPPAEPARTTSVDRLIRQPLSRPRKAAPNRYKQGLDVAPESVQKVPVSESRGESSSVSKDGNLITRAGSSSRMSNHGEESEAPVKVLDRSVTSSGSSGGSDSGSSSDSENERREREERRKMRERLLAERVAARAAEAIKRRENVVAKLEGEKQSLEKIVEERVKQQVQEASELQTSMMETMDAVELEKQKHNSTRMEALERLAELETTNAELAKSLANTQWDLEIEANRVAELHRKIRSKEGAHEDLRMKLSKIHQHTPSLGQLESSRGADFEQEIFEAEYSFICDKILQLQEKAKKLKETIEMTQKEIVHPTEVEMELKKRLAQLTDRLIQKQTQVEALSSEKATLLFRIETVSGSLNENRLVMPMDDLEAGTSGFTNLRPRLRDKIRTGERHLGPILIQLDAIFSAGAVYLRRNPTGKLWAFVYVICLHLWVLYILFVLNSAPGSGGSAAGGAVFSLETIAKNSSGV